MGSSHSNDIPEGLNLLMQWLTEKAFHDMKPNTDFRHLTPSEQTIIENTILRGMETNRRVEIKLLQLGYDDPDILDCLYY